MAEESVFGKRIKELRIERGLSASQLGAEIMGKSEGAVRSWETGKAMPEGAAIMALALFFHVSTDYLFGITDVRTNSPAEKLKGDIAALSAEIEKLARRQQELESILRERMEMVQETRGKIAETERLIASRQDQKKQKEYLLAQFKADEEKNRRDE